MDWSINILFKFQFAVERIEYTPSIASASSISALILRVQVRIYHQRHERARLRDAKCCLRTKALPWDKWRVEVRFRWNNRIIYQPSSPLVDWVILFLLSHQSARATRSSSRSTQKKGHAVETTFASEHVPLILDQLRELLIAVPQQESQAASRFAKAVCPWMASRRERQQIKRLAMMVSCLTIWSLHSKSGEDYFHKALRPPSGICRAVGCLCDQAEHCMRRGTVVLLELASALCILCSFKQSVQPFFLLSRLADCGILPHSSNNWPQWRALSVCSVGFIKDPYECSFLKNGEYTIIIYICICILIK